ncbi:hypothetical protein P7K49_023055 [Saguinus oedipus]|uniref:Cytosolic Fe-S cluster assembly factor NUBP1 n=1 Tax=Saguinus oedipus TaxID=9490 RepID=A0ABQ9UKM6_SAGOE|nr:hypothetical protein P7K49_023055 [Saguinus oedipus]
MQAGDRAVAVYVVAGFLLARSSPREDSPTGSAWKLGLGVLGCSKSPKRSFPLTPLSPFPWAHGLELIQDGFSISCLTRGHSLHSCAFTKATSLLHRYPHFLNAGPSRFLSLLKYLRHNVIFELLVPYLDTQAELPNNPARGTKEVHDFYKRTSVLLFTQVHQSGSGWSPVYMEDNLGVMSVGFLLSSPDDAVIWRGPKKNGMIKQFLRDVDWGEVDYLIVDTPPGTSDEHLSVVQYLAAAHIDGAVIITTPQEVSLQDVRKEISFCRKVKLPIIGVVENMSGFICPKCKKESQIFPPTTGGAELMCKDLEVPLLGRVPLDPLIAHGSISAQGSIPALKSISAQGSIPALKSISGHGSISAHRNIPALKSISAHGSIPAQRSTSAHRSISAYWTIPTLKSTSAHRGIAAQRSTSAHRSISAYWTIPTLKSTSAHRSIRAQRSTSAHGSITAQRSISAYWRISAHGSVSAWWSISVYFTF